MNMARLSDCLVGTRLASVETVRAAIARQSVYGGALDTALLEMAALDEPTLWQALAQATGLPLPPPALYETPGRYEVPAGAPLALDAAWSERCRAVPVGVDGGVVQVLCGEPVARAEIDAASAALGIAFALYVVPEARLAAVRQAVYERPMPPRLVRVFARVAGTQPVRRWQAAQAKPVAAPAQGTIEILARPVPATPPPAPPSAGGPSLPALPAERAPPKRAPVAPKVDKREVAALIARLKGDGADAAAALAALVAITKQDFGPRPRRWEAWWGKHQDEDRVEWLFEGLAHKTPEIRASSEEELRALTGEYFGYHFDLPRRERDEARARWQSWWHESGRARKT
jgi:hypothetical protein